MCARGDRGSGTKARRSRNRTRGREGCWVFVVARGQMCGETQTYNYPLFPEQGFAEVINSIP